MKSFKFHNTEVSLNFTTYLSNGTLAVKMNSVPDEDSFGVITVNLSCPLQSDRLAFIDENNYPGIGAWLQANGIASPFGYTQRSGFCQYELFEFNTAL